MDNKRKLLKIITIGDRMVGKLSIIKNYMGRPFFQWGNSIPFDFHFKEIIIDNETVSLQLWNTHGSAYEDSKIYYRDVDCCVVCFNIHNEQSFNNLIYWIKELEANTLVDEKVPFVLIGTKSDIERTEKSISKERIEQWCKQIEDQGIVKEKIHYFETSAKLSTNIIEAYETIVKIALNQYKNKQKNSINISIEPEKPKGIFQIMIFMGVVFYF
ncbi:Rab GTPase [Dictyostelium discoideum AX4]|uniref:Ras-related protein RabK1 n=1 Tax=Dictyostelium discoideum TaxID=44689 RepID=RABK1_DICDI|nr:Rab GTPase [Dictyostelium discoideum AX4]Q54FK4.3 RecName: Full=Ras-related protein RabK1 [Dictyostelium discoideum]EAL62050.3 Rab GTPase [Dictyostelium discoideum AX4]|eukprot:XP_635536.3 Rab GTPase [Dictyostelium discoideum AX4]